MPHKMKKNNNLPHATLQTKDNGDLRYSTEDSFKNLKGIERRVRQI
jgi:hypothetical protein